ncbi:MAG TPA: Asp23/Gls24 family envelope stress response protein [Clostridia bacterium]|nr:Asp23/Gls24 family envelope stress response protein [Clostridia bacterium]
MKEVLLMDEQAQLTNNDYGKTIIANEVVSVIAGLAASEIPGVSSMSSGLVDDITTSLGMKSAKRGVKVELIDDVAKIGVSVIVEYGIQIPQMAHNLRTAVIEAVQSMTGLTVDEVNIYVQGVHLVKEVPDTIEAT